METTKAKLRADYLDTLRSIANMASIYWHQDRLLEAEMLEVQVMDISKTKLGSDHPGTL